METGSRVCEVTQTLGPAVRPTACAIASGTMAENAIPESGVNICGITTPMDFVKMRTT
jgi:hypothetical protein